MNGDWTEGVVRYVRNAPIPENDLAFELGEMFYQLRAALDHLVYKATVLKHGSEPPPHENIVAFPICPNSDTFNRNPVNKPPFPNQLAVWLENIQPYNVGKHRGTETEFFIRALIILHDCARKDRHRRLHIVAAIPTHVKFLFDAWPGRVVSYHPLLMNLLEGKDELMRITCTEFTPREGKLSSQVEFRCLD